MNVFEKINNILMNYEKPSLEIEKMFKCDDFNDSDFRIIKDLKSIKQNLKYHPEGNVWNHTKLVIDLAAKIRCYTDNEQLFMWSALFHDIGKLNTTKVIKGRYTSYNHDVEGARTTYKILNKYMDESLVNKISEIVRFHMHHIYILKELPFSDIDGLLKSDVIEYIVLVFICDKSGRGILTKDNISRNIEEVKEIVFFLEKNYNAKLKEIIEKIDDVKNKLLN